MVVSADRTFSGNSRFNAWRYAIAGIIIFSVLLHIGYFAVNYARGVPSIGVDGPVYRDAALAYLQSETVLGEKCRVPFWTPWYVIIAAVGATPLGVFSLNLTALVATLTAMYGVGRLLQMRDWAIMVASACYAFYWPTFDYVVFYHYEIFLGTGLMLCVFLVAHWSPKLVESPRLRYWCALGLLAGLMVFAHSRAVAAVLVPLVVLVLEWRAVRRRWKKLLCYSACVVSLTGLWGVRNKMVIDHWVFSSTSIGYNLHVGYNEIATGFANPQPPFPPVDRALGIALDYIAKNPARSAWLTMKRIVLFWSVSPPGQFGPTVLLVQEYLMLPLGFGGFLLLMTAAVRAVSRKFSEDSDSGIHRRDWAMIGLAVVVLMYVGFHAFFYLSLPRFRIPVVPELCLAAAFLIERIVLLLWTKLR